MKEKISSILGLFFSGSTLLCCALPAFIAIVAGGAAVGALVSAVPWLIPLSQNKDWLFLGAGLMLLINVYVIFMRPQRQKLCDITGDEACNAAGIWSKMILWVSLSIYGIGAFVAYALVPIIRFFES